MAWPAGGSNDRPARRARACPATPAPRAAGECPVVPIAGRRAARARRSDARFLACRLGCRQVSRWWRSRRWHGGQCASPDKWIPHLMAIAVINGTSAKTRARPSSLASHRPLAASKLSRCRRASELPPVPTRPADLVARFSLGRAGAPCSPCARAATLPAPATFCALLTHRSPACRLSSVPVRSRAFCQMARQPMVQTLARTPPPLALAQDPL